ncbi:hypothetical protein KC359_g142 [Hortaea werneckii]|nr:hypothetical protein KC359_g142 [Hortaea werneckii]KAI7515072.1 hypothetical protein KC347_g137 [Hortaea werneckii]
MLRGLQQPQTSLLDRSAYESPAISKMVLRPLSRNRLQGRRGRTDSFTVTSQSFAEGPARVEKTAMESLRKPAALAKDGHHIVIGYISRSASACEFPQFCSAAISIQLLRITDGISSDRSLCSISFASWCDVKTSLMSLTSSGAAPRHQRMSFSSPAVPMPLSSPMHAA